MQTRPVTGLGSRRLFRFLGLPAMVLVVSLWASALPARAATLITYWNFNSASTGGTGNTGVFPATGNESYSSGMISSDSGSLRSGSLDVSLLQGTANGGFNGGTTLGWGALYNSGTLNNAQGSDVAGSAFAVVGNTTNNSNGSHGSDALTFQLNGTGYTNLGLTLSERLSGTSPAPSIAWTYSLDGGTTWENATPGGTNATSGNWSGTMTVGLGSDADNASSILLRGTLTFNNASGTTASFGLDNVQFTGTAAVPEPSAVALLAIGAGAVLWRLRRRPALA